MVATLETAYHAAASAGGRLAGKGVGGRRRVEIGAVRDRQHITDLLIDGFKGPVGGRAAVDEVTGRTDDRRPLDRYLASAPDRPHVTGRWQRDGRRRSVAFDLGTEGREPRDPGRLRHGRGIRGRSFLGIRSVARAGRGLDLLHRRDSR